MDRTITVTGRGSAQAVPDTAVVRLAANHRAADVAQALAGVADAVGTLGAVARRFTEPRRVQTTELTVWPAYDEAGRPSGYEARHGLPPAKTGDTGLTWMLSTMVARRPSTASFSAWRSGITEDTLCTSETEGRRSNAASFTASSSSDRAVARAAKPERPAATDSVPAACRFMKS